MKVHTLFKLIVAAVFAFTLPAAPAATKPEAAHGHAPKHGGVVAEVNHMDVELVVRADAVRSYLRDHDKPVKLDGASAKVTLLVGSDKTEAALTPAGDRLEARGVFKPGAGVKAVAVINLPGKAPVTARFALK